QGPSQLSVGSDGASVYWTEAGNGNDDHGAVFALGPDGVVRQVGALDFAVGGESGSGVIEGADGALYGIATYGGRQGDGSVFRMTQAGESSALLSFGGRRGKYPRGMLVRGPDGSLFGTSSNGGVDALGTIFKLAPDGTFSTLFGF